MEQYYILIAILSGFTFFGAYLFLMQKQFRQQMKLTEHQMLMMQEYFSRMSEQRYGMEKRILELNYKLTNDENKWRDINHLLVNAMNQNEKRINKKTEITNFIESFGLNSEDIGSDKNTVFVLTPFHPEMIKTFELIKDIGESERLKVLRGDEKLIEANILKHIISLIVKSRFLIVNLTGRNPNVLYELGIAHAINKPTILISKTIKDIPFDIKDRRIIIYQDENELVHKLRDSIKQLLVEI